MWVKWLKQYHGSKSRSGRVCQNITWTRPWGLVLYKGSIREKKNSSPTRNGSADGGPAEGEGLSGSILPLIDLPSGTNVQRPIQKAEKNKKKSVYCFSMLPSCVLIYRRQYTHIHTDIHTQTQTHIVIIIIIIKNLLTFHLINKTNHEYLLKRRYLD